MMDYAPYGDERNLQKDKHHCNTRPIWALWQSGQTQATPQWRHMKTHLELAKQHLKDSLRLKETQFSCLMNLSSKHHVWRKPSTAQHQHKDECDAVYNVWAWIIHSNTNEPNVFHVLCHWYAV